MSRLLRKGIGWRVGWHPEAEYYQGLIGGMDWAFEVTRDEFLEFYRLLLQLANTMSQMAAELMDEERISIEAESNLLWLEVEGFPHDYSLRLILSRERRCEGNWSSGVAPELLVVLQRIIEENCQD